MVQHAINAMRSPLSLFWNQFILANYKILFKFCDSSFIYLTRLLHNQNVLYSQGHLWNHSYLSIFVTKQMTTGGLMSIIRFHIAMVFSVPENSIITNH